MGFGKRCAHGLRKADLAGGFGGLEGNFKAFAFHFENGNAVFLHEVDECAYFFGIHNEAGFLLNPDHVTRCLVGSRHGIGQRARRLEAGQ